MLGKQQRAKGKGGMVWEKKSPIAKSVRGMAKRRSTKEKMLQKRGKAWVGGDLQVIEKSR
jgi:hypothetical protein